MCQTQGLSLVDLWRDEGPAHGENNTFYEEEMFANNTLRVIQEHNTSFPLFLFHSFHLIHTPLEVPKPYEEQFSFLKIKARRLYAAMVHYMDQKLGLFVDALQKKGMWDNTIMVGMTLPNTDLSAMIHLSAIDHSIVTPFDTRSSPATTAALYIRQDCLSKARLCLVAPTTCHSKEESSQIGRCYCP